MGAQGGLTAQASVPGPPFALGGPGARLWTPEPGPAQPPEPDRPTAGPRRDVQAPFLIWPSAGPLESPYGMRWGRPHRGIDIDGESGDPVRAADAGWVRRADDVGNGYGLTVEIAHRGRFHGVRTAYAHLSRVRVRPGQRVRAGQVIGNIGTSGSVTGSHLHFEVRLRTGAVDPLAYLVSDRPVRPTRARRGSPLAGSGSSRAAE